MEVDTEKPLLTRNEDIDQNVKVKYTENRSESWPSVQRVMSSSFSKSTGLFVL